MWPLLIGAGAGGLLGVGKRALFDKPREEHERQTAAAMERYSPWTGVHGQMPQQGNYGNNLLQGLSGGMEAGQSVDDQMNKDALTQKKLSEAPGAASGGYSMPQLGSQFSGQSPGLGLGVNTNLGSQLDPAFQDPMLSSNMGRGSWSQVPKLPTFYSDNSPNLKGGS